MKKSTILHNGIGDGSNCECTENHWINKHFKRVKKPQNNQYCT